MPTDAAEPIPAAAPVPGSTQESLDSVDITKRSITPTTDTTTTDDSKRFVTVVDGGPSPTVARRTRVNPADYQPIDAVPLYQQEQRKAKMQLAAFQSDDDGRSRHSKRPV